jgi:hypothetical protein
MISRGKRTMHDVTTTQATNVDSAERNERLELANQLYREYHARCFWHCRRDLEITEELIPFVVKGLRAHGGRRGFILSGKLRPSLAAGSDREKRKCP